MQGLERTIVAIATPAGRGGVGALRVSGPDARSIGEQLFRPVRSGTNGADGRPVFGRFLDRAGRAVDHGYLVVFEAGASFTGEQTVELWTHGSPAVQRALLEAALAAGAASAAPGEFTYRALCHGRIDLSRAEAIRDLVAARTAWQARLAFAQADGALARRVAPLRERLADVIARAEAAVEFVEEADVHLPDGMLEDGVEELRRGIEELLRGFRAGRIARSGATVAIVGKPNVGKSSLFNQLLARDRAIVSTLPGTTRDTLEEEVDLDGIPVRLVDTAGLREAGDDVEGEGVRRARAAIEDCDLVLLVLDGSRRLDAEDEAALARTERDARPGLVVANKADLPAAFDRAGLLRTSALTGRGVDALRGALRERLAGGAVAEDPVVTDARHADALETAAAALARAAAASKGGFTEEILLDDLREAMNRIGEITGAFANEALYEKIFSTFCIGK